MFQCEKKKTEHDEDRIEIRIIQGCLTTRYALNSKTLRSSIHMFQIQKKKKLT